MERLSQGGAELHEGAPASPTATLFELLGIPADPAVVARTDEICGAHIAAELEMLSQFTPGSEEHSAYLGLLGQMAGVGLSGRNPTA